MGNVYSARLLSYVLFVGLFFVLFSSQGLAINATNDTALVQINTPTIINLTGNDVGTNLSVGQLSTPSNGTLVYNYDGTVTYYPPVGFKGTVTFNYTLLSNGLYSNDTGHYYQYVQVGSLITWTQANASAANRTLDGLQGYLTTITSAAESSFVSARLQGEGWLGASDAAMEGNWTWTSGPEAGQQFWSGASGGSPVNGSYTNWNTGEPNNCCGSENYAQFLNNGKWNDYPNNGNIQAYVVEYGGMPGDNVSELPIAFVTITVDDTYAPSLQFVSPTPDAYSIVGGNATFNITTSDASNQTYLLLNDSSILAWYRFENNSALGEDTSIVYDWSGRGFQLNGSGGVLLSNASKFGKGYVFDDTGYFGAGNHGALLPGSNYSVSLWAKFNVINQTYRTLAAQWDVGTQQLFTLQLNTNDKLGFFTGDGATNQAVVESSDVLVQNEWYHIVGTVAGTQANLYINGFLNETGTAITPGLTTANFTLGAKRNGSGGLFEYLNGSMDEVIYFNKTLTANEVLLLYNSTGRSLSKFVSGAGMRTEQGLAVDSSGNMNASSRSFILDQVNISLSYASPSQTNNTYTNLSSVVYTFSITEDALLRNITWNFNDTAYALLDRRSLLLLDFDAFGMNDSSSHNMTVLSSGYSLGSGVYGNSLVLNGTTRNNISTSGSLNIPGNFTLGFWANETSTSFMHVLSNKAYADSSKGVAIASNLSLYFFALGDGSSAVRFSVNVSADSWKHIALTVIPQGTCTAYVNAVPSYVADCSSLGVGTINTTNTWYIGADGAQNDSLFAGSLDELRLFNYSLSASEVYAIYATRLGRFNATQWNISINQSRNSTTSLGDGFYTVFLNISDEYNQTRRSLSRIVGVDRTPPSIVSYYAINNTVYENATTINISVNASDFSGTVSVNATIHYPNATVSNVSLFNVSSSLFTGTFTLPWYNGNYTVRYAAIDLAGNLFNESLLVVTMNATDADQDGFPDSHDTLIGNESNLNISGITNLNITVAGNTTNGTFSGSLETLFYDGSTPLINFTHNYSNTSVLNLSKVTILRSSNSIVVNFSNQLTGNKTLYLADNSFVRFCVKDAPLSVLGNISSSCDGEYETDFDDCIGNTTGVTIGNITCAEVNNTFIVSNLQHSGLLGTPAEQTSSISSNSGGRGGGSWGSPSGKIYNITTNMTRDGAAYLTITKADSIIYNHLATTYRFIVRAISEDGLSLRIIGYALDGNYSYHQNYGLDLDDDGKTDLVMLLDTDGTTVTFSFTGFVEQLPAAEIEPAAQNITMVERTAANETFVPQGRVIDTSKLEQPLWGLWLLIVCVCIAILGYFIFFFYKRRKRKEQPQDVSHTHKE